MNTKLQSRVASMLAVAVGLWMVLVPAFTSMTGGALTNILITGGIIAAAGLVQLFWENVLPSWVNAVAAVWLAVSAFGFDVSTAVAWNMVLGAIAAFLIAMWNGAEVNQLYKTHHQQM